MLRSLSVLTIMQTRMLLRNRITLVTSLGIGLISMLLFGALFGSGEPTCCGWGSLTRIARRPPSGSSRA